MSQILAGHALIILTKNRPELLDRQLPFLRKNTSIPEILIISDASDVFQKTTHQKRYQNLYKQLITISSEPGIAAQRNQAVSKLPHSIEFVHFLDDDFFPEPNYFEEINRCFQQDLTILGVGGLIYQTKISKPVFFDPSTAGTVAKNGRTLDAQVYPLTREQLFDTFYLSGCSMSFRKNVFAIQIFDELLTNYAQDEDLDFCLGIKGRLVVTPFTSGWHEKANQDRIHQQEFKKMAILNRFYVMKKQFQSEFSLSDYLASVFLQFLILLKSPIKNQALIRGLVQAVSEILINKSS